MTQIHALVTHVPAQISDVVTPVSVYLKLRDVYPNTALLESTDYHAYAYAMSFVCFDPISEFLVEKNTMKILTDNVVTTTKEITAVGEAVKELDNYISTFEVKGDCPEARFNGVFGYTGYDAVQHFDSLKLQDKSDKPYAVPDIRYTAYRKILAFSHFSHRMFLIENLREGEQSDAQNLFDFFKNPVLSQFTFEPLDDEQSNVTDEEYKQMVAKGKEHCFRGDVFQIVLSRQFSRGFEGDEFNVYRALRHVNPSPYMFFFDYGTYKIFGSSPETELVIKKGVAEINPIAGTFRRTGNIEKDKQLAELLKEDPKESAEHVMLVDLARNDLSRHCDNVKVNNFKEIQFYSHVLHMVSNVSGRLVDGATSSGLMAATFPAGTLSGAPKYKAMQLIDTIENQPRGVYGGCIGIMRFDHDFDQAIMIRTFLSKGNRLYYQAGAGVVAKSVEENELQEVNNKLGALTKALEIAKDF